MELLKKKVQNNILWKVIFCLAFLGNTVSSLWLIHTFQILIDAAIESNRDIFEYSIKSFMIILIINMGFNILDQYAFRSLSNYGEMNLKKYTVHNYLFNVASAENRNVGKVMSRINSDIPIISSWLSKGEVNTYLQIVYLTVCLIFMLYYSVDITCIILFLIISVFFVSRYFSIKESQNTKELQDYFEIISDKIYNSFLNLKMIRQLGKQEYFAKKVKVLSLDNTEKQIKNLGMCVAMNAAMLGFMTDILPLLTFFLGILKCSVGTGLSLMLIAQKLNEPIIVLAELLAEKKNAEQVYERVQELYKEIPDEDKTKKNPVRPFEQFDIKIKEFCYEKSEDVVLKDVNLHIARGDLWVIQGESGNGKSTLLKIIAKFLNLEDEEGRIEYNHENIQEFNLEKYYQHLLMVEQNAIIIEGSLEENLFLGDSFSRDEIEKAIYISKLEDFYKKKGENYIIKENGKNISGGEKQRINLARIILRKPEILLLDEATSNLDEELRKEIIFRLMEYAKKKQMTLIAVSHNDDFECYYPQKYIL